MKIGITCPYDMFKGGGVQECVVALQHELKARGHEVKILTPKPLHFKGTIPDDMILIGKSADVKALHTTGQISVTLHTKELNKVLEQEQFDIIHFHEPWVPIMSQQILKHSSAAHVATFHARFPDDPVSKALKKAIAPYAISILGSLDEIVAVSDAAAENARSFDDRAIQIIPNGIDLKKYTWVDRGSVNDTPTILYVGRLEKRKGVVHLINAFALLQASLPAAQLIIAGDGVDRKKLEAKVQKMELKNVTFTGFISEQEKLDLLGRADIFCSPALYGESFGIVLLEAIARGCVIVAGNNPGYSVVLSEVADVSLVDSTDTALFAQKLTHLLTDQTAREQWLKWAQDYIKQFDYRLIVDEYEKVYKKALGKKAERSKRKK